MVSRTFSGMAALCALLPLQAAAQSITNMAALRGLAPVTVLSNTYAGRAALGANYTITGGIQTGTIRQPTLLPFAYQQQQVLRDAFLTYGNVAELSDGLGTTLGAAYQARAHYIDRQQFTNVSQAVADVIAYADATTGADSNAGKYFFANATTDGRTPTSAEAVAIFKDIGGTPDIFGTSYGRPAGRPEPLVPTHMVTRARSRPNRAFCRSPARTISTFPRTTWTIIVGRS
jgi:hypothetical protein